MGLKGRAFRGSLLLAVGEGIVYVAAFTRNMILARMLSKADFGVAATFSLVMMLLEFAAKLGVAQYLVRSPEGDKPEFIATAHFVQLNAALLSSIAIIACAGPLSSLFGIPSQKWAIMLLALAPLFRGLEHLDVRRFERHLRFAPSLLVEAVPQIVITAAAWPVAAWLGDYRAVLVLFLVKGLTSCIGSHLAAERPYQWRLQRNYIQQMLGFGWPLVINGFLMFGVFQGDQFLIAASYSMADLAPYAASAALAVAPSFFFGRVFNSVMLPVLANAQTDPAVFAKRYRQVLAGVTLFATGCGLGMILGGEALMRMVYGAKYAGAGVLLGWLSAASAFRTLRIAPALAALARGDSQNQMIANLWRVTALVPAAAFALSQQSLPLIACTGLLGEALAGWISFVRLKRRDSVPLSSSLIPAGWILLAVGTAGALAVLGVHQLPTILGLGLATIGACVGGAAMIAALSELRNEATGLYEQWRQAGWRGCLDALGHTR